MFGSLRFLLAYLVILSHLVGTEYVAHFGFYAVRGFFVISGLMMTAALNEVYGFDGVRFWTNRALRLLPPYYFVCVLTLIAITIAPSEAAEYLKFWHGLPDAGELLINLAVLPLQFPYGSIRLVPPFWSVAIEIDMYLLLYLVVSRQMGWALIALVAGLSFQLACVYDAMNWTLTYFTAPSAVFPFAVGAVLYFLRQHGRWVATPLAAGFAFAAWIANMLAGGTVFPASYIFGWGYLFDTICFGVVVSYLSALPSRQFGPLVERIDRAFGEWSYFAFLVHWLAGLLVAGILLNGETRGWTLLLAVTPVVLAASAAFAMLNRKFLEPLRNRVRRSHGRSRPATSVAIPIG
ncbi:acyltransferase family protein [Bradyrhizobium sp.]|uniref:acyltransferase family protein n=1 Tax=Bradyrhizobium sp. TaxID=376 RepID=UPI003C723E2B